MEKIKSLFEIGKTTFALDEKDELFFLEDNDNLWYESTLFFKKNEPSKVLIYRSLFYIEIFINKFSIYNLEKKFEIVLEKVFQETISYFDTCLVENFLAVCFESGEYFILNLITFQEELFLSDYLLLNTNGKKIIEWDSNKGQLLITENYKEVSKIEILDNFIDKATLKEKRVSIDKAIKSNVSNQFILQANYNNLYLLSLDNNKVISTVILKNIFLGDTISFEYGDYHITSECIYKIDWQTKEASLVLNWSKETGCDTFPGISVLFAYGDVIVFVGTSAKIIVFYSAMNNKIISYAFHSTTFYKNAPCLLTKNKIYIVDSEGLPHILNYPN